MLAIQDFAPAFDCRAVVQGEIVPLSWSELHREEPLVLLFDSVEEACDDLIAVQRNAGALNRLKTRVAVVCREDAFDVLHWNDQLATSCGTADLVFSCIVDAHNDIAWLYDMTDADGMPLWGSVLVDRAGRIRQMVSASVRVGIDVQELLRCVQSLDRDPRPPGGGPSQHGKQER